MGERRVGEEEGRGGKGEEERRERRGEGQQLHTTSAHM